MLPFAKQRNTEAFSDRQKRNPRSEAGVLLWACARRQAEREELDRQLSAISKKTEVDDALEALKSRLADRAPTSSATSTTKEKEKISSAFDEK